MELANGKKYTATAFCMWFHRLPCTFVSEVSIAIIAHFAPQYSICEIWDWNSNRSFQFLAIKVRDTSIHERERCLTLDEMSIAAGVEFDTRSGHFIGDVTLPDHTGVATHSSVFMLGRITTRWKQTVAYYLHCKFHGWQCLCSDLLSIIKRCYENGLRVAAVTWRTSLRSFPRQ